MSTTDQLRETFLTHTPDTDPAQAAEQFEQRTGSQPEKQFTEYGLLWSGPVNEGLKLEDPSG